MNYYEENTFRTQKTGSDDSLALSRGSGAVADVKPDIKPGVPLTVSTASTAYVNGQSAPSTSVGATVFKFDHFAPDPRQMVPFKPKVMTMSEDLIIIDALNFSLSFQVALRRFRVVFTHHHMLLRTSCSDYHRRNASPDHLCTWTP